MTAMNTFLGIVKNLPVMDIAVSLVRFKVCWNCLPGQRYSPTNANTSGNIITIDVSYWYIQPPIHTSIHPSAFQKFWASSYQWNVGEVHTLLKRKVKSVCPSPIPFHHQWRWQHGYTSSIQNGVCFSFYLFFIFL